VAELPERGRGGPAQRGRLVRARVPGERADVLRPAGGTDRGRRGDPDVQDLVVGQQPPQRREHRAHRAVGRDQRGDRALVDVVRAQRPGYRGDRVHAHAEQRLGHHAGRHRGLSAYRAQRVEQGPRRPGRADQPERAGGHQADLGRPVRQERQQHLDVLVPPGQPEQVGMASPADRGRRPQAPERPGQLTAPVEQPHQLDGRLAAHLVEQPDRRHADPRPHPGRRGVQRGRGRPVVVLAGADREQDVPVGRHARLPRRELHGAQDPGGGHEQHQQHARHGQHGDEPDEEARAGHERDRASTEFTRWRSSRGLNGLAT
jgi:hypothetical protein